MLCCRTTRLKLGEPPVTVDFEKPRLTGEAAECVDANALTRARLHWVLRGAVVWRERLERVVERARADAIAAADLGEGGRASAIENENRPQKILLWNLSRYGLVGAASRIPIVGATDNECYD